MPVTRTVPLVGQEAPAYIVCIGASAGGLEALIALLKLLPDNLNMALIIIQHLEPQHKSALPEILSRESCLNVQEALDNMKIKSGHVYVIPPNTQITVSMGRLKITNRIKRADGKYLPIDFFMASLAKDQGNKSIGVILSGTGSDGTEGIKDIKAKGGITFAQDKKTAQYHGMPENARSSGCIDFVLAPAEIAKKLMQINMHGHLKTAIKTSKKKSAPAPNGLSMILGFLRDYSGADFFHYKQTTINRRIARRLIAQNTKKHTDYYNYLIKTPSEADILLKDIFISVTSFFRDPGIFTALKKKVFPLLTDKKTDKNPIRIWVTACSTGEEVYSIAIALLEYMEEKKIKSNFQIFGTDLSEPLIIKARTGLYPEKISLNVSADRLRRFFVKTDTGYKIHKHIRERCIFAKHDITSDPPLSNMDIGICRNLLIYFDTFLQNKALSMLHYAIKPKGFLLLGMSESVTAAPYLFTIVDKNNRIFIKNSTLKKSRPQRDNPASLSDSNQTTGHLIEEKKMKRSPDNHTLPAYLHPKKKNRIKIKPPKELISEKNYHGHTAKEFARLRKDFARTVERLQAITEEKETLNEELKAANEEIQSGNEELQSTNEELETSKEELQSTNEELLSLNDELQNGNTELTRLNNDLNNVFSSTNIPMIIVGNDMRIKRFTPMARKVMNLIPSDMGRPLGDIKLNININNLEEIVVNVMEEMVPKELEVTDREGRWYSMRLRPYRTMDNRIDGAIISMIDVNEIKHVQEEAQSALDYSQAIIETMREPLIVLDGDGHIVSANSSFYETFKVSAAEMLSKTFYELNGSQWNNPELRKLLEEILPKKTHFSGFEITLDFPVTGRKILLLNGCQIKMHGKEKQMILLVLKDITERKNIENGLEKARKELEAVKILEDEAREYSESIINTVREPLISLDQDLRVVTASRSFYDVFKVNPEETVGQLIYDLGNKQWDIPKLRELLETILPQKASFDNYEVEHDFATIGKRIMLLNARQIQRISGKERIILLSIEDITERKKASDLLKRDSDELEKIVKSRTRELLDLQVRLERSKHLADIGTLAATVAHELRNTLAAISVATYNIRKKAKDPQIERSLSNIEKKITESDQIINNVLSYSKIKVSHFETIKINDVLEACIVDAKKQIISQGISFISEISPTAELSIEADIGQIKEVFSNILNNARDAMSGDNGVIRIKTSIDNRSATILIEDNGEGIEKEDIPKVTTPFFTTKAKGTGLGLAVCNQILMLHDGSLDIESTIKKGTAVRVTLPIRRIKNAKDSSD